MSEFLGDDIVECPHCKKLPEFQDKRVPQLECAERNYSGTGCDMANCPNCGKGYQVSYMVESICPATSWDLPIDPA